MRRRIATPANPSLRSPREYNCVTLRSRSRWRKTTTGKLQNFGQEWLFLAAEKDKSYTDPRDVQKMLILLILAIIVQGGEVS